jgi:hypothetical protein
MTPLLAGVSPMAITTGLATLSLLAILATQRPGDGSPVAPDAFAAMCAELDSTYACASAIERHQLAKPELAAVAARTARGLELRLATGSLHTLRDIAGSDDVDDVSYSFREYLKDIRYFLVHRQRYEMRDYVLVHARTGREFAIEEVPVVSPDRARLVTTLAGLSGMSTGNGVQIWRLEQNSPRLEFELRPSDWEPAEAVWLDARTIRLRKLAPIRGEGRAFSTTVRLVHEGRWRYVE